MVRRSPARSLLYASLVALGLPMGADAQGSGGSSPVFPEELSTRLLDRIESHDGLVGVSVIDLSTGARFGVREDEAFPSASVVKIPIMIEIFAQVGEGSLGMEEPLSLLDIDRALGSGVLHRLTAPKEISVWDATYLMITASDNTATDLLLAKVSPQSVNRRMSSMGFSTTRVLLPAVNAGPGESFAPQESGYYGFGVASAREIAEMLEAMYRDTMLGAEASGLMIEILSSQLYVWGIPRRLPDQARVANKMGSTLTSRNDCGIVFGPESDFVLCVMTRDNADQRWGVENEAYRLIGDLSSLVYEELNPSGG